MTYEQTDEIATCSRDDLMWLVGLLEGEGCFGILSGRNPFITLRMTDRDVVERAAKLVDRRVQGPLTNGRPKHYKPIYQLSVYGPAAISWMRRLQPHMGLRRAAKMTEVLSKWSPKFSHKRRQTKFMDWNDTVLPATATLTVEDVAAQLGVSQQLVNRLTADGKLKSFHFKRFTRYEQTAVDEYLKVRKRQSRRLSTEEQAKLLTLAQAAEKLAVPLNTMRTYLERYKIPSTYALGQRWFEPSIIDAFVKPQRWTDDERPIGMLTATEAAKRMGFRHHESMHTLTRQGKIRCHRGGEGKKQRVYFDPVDVDAYANSSSRRPGP